MAKECALCNKKITQAFPLSFEFKDVLICGDCHRTLNILRNSDLKETDSSRDAKKYAYTHWRNIDKKQLKTYIDEIVNKAADYDEYLRAEAEKAAEIEDKKASVILTTASCIDGYKIIKQGGLVFGETIFKTSMLKGLMGGIEDTFNALSFFSSTEMSGITSVLKEAREYAINKMIEEAVGRGCNAIIGVDSESSAGNTNLIHITIYGTAVYVEKLE